LKFVDNDISAFSKSVFRCCRQLVIVHMLTVQNFVCEVCSVCCAHALIVHMYNAYDWLRSSVFVYMFPTLNVMGRGSQIRWVNGSWPIACSGRDLPEVAFHP